MEDEHHMGEDHQTRELMDAQYHMKEEYHMDIHTCTEEGMYKWKVEEEHRRQELRQEKEEEHPRIVSGDTKAEDMSMEIEVVDLENGDKQKYPTIDYV